MVLRNLWCFILILPLLCASAQTDTVVVFFKDKASSTFSINQPSYYLSPKAIAKRIHLQIDIDSLDLPVNTNYLEDLIQSGAKVIYTLKWFNAALITYDLSNQNTIFNKPYIDHVDVLVSSSLGGTLISQSNSTHYGNSTSVMEFMDVPYMHQLGYRGDGVLIGVIDSGFEGVDTLSLYKRLRDENRIVYTYDIADQESNVYNDHMHGTYVLSVLAADSASYYVGIVPDASYVLLRSEIANKELRIEEYNWVKALEIADSCGVDVINSSLGYNLFDVLHQSYTINDMNGSTTICAQGTHFAYKKGLIIIVSAGNEGNKSWQKVTTPGDSPYVITVGSVNSTGYKSDFSSMGPTTTGNIKPDVVAIGNVFPCVGPDGKIKVTGGTSLASPMITGMVAAILQKESTMPPAEMMALLKRSASNHLQPNNQIGYGIPKFKEAIDLLSLKTLSKSLYVYPNPAQVGITPKLILPDNSYEVSIYDTRGALLLTKELNAEWGIMDLPIEMNQWAAGMYVIVIHTASDVQYIRWVKP
jgi:hypothetical protein